MSLRHTDPPPGQRTKGRGVCVAGERLHKSAVRVPRCSCSFVRLKHVQNNTFKSTTIEKNCPVMPPRCTSEGGAGGMSDTRLCASGVGPQVDGPPPCSRVRGGKADHPRCVLWRLSAAPACWRGAWAVSGALSGDGLAPITAGRDNATPHRTALWLAAWGVQVRPRRPGLPRCRCREGAR